MQFCKGPEWLRATKGMEFHRYLRRLKHEGDDLKEFEPSEYDKVIKQFRYLYKVVNRRRRYQTL